MGTQAQQTWIWVGNHLWQILLFGSLFIQIAPIKINPWSALLKWIGKLITGDACTKIDGLIEKVNNILSEEFEVEVSEMTPDANIKQTLQLDSLSIVDMVALIENEFQVKIKPAEVSQLTTFGKLYDYIAEHI